jgi:hypothetical protein
MHAPTICVCGMGCECVRAYRSDLSFSNDEIILTMIFCIINKPIAAILFKSRLHQFRLHSSPPPGIEVIFFFFFFLGGGGGGVLDVIL